MHIKPQTSGFSWKTIWRSPWDHDRCAKRAARFQRSCALPSSWASVSPARSGCPHRLLCTAVLLTPDWHHPWLPAWLPRALYPSLSATSFPGHFVDVGSPVSGVWKGVEMEAAACAPDFAPYSLALLCTPCTPRLHPILTRLLPILPWLRPSLLWLHPRLP